MNVSQLTPLQRAFMALEETRAKLARLENAHREPIAVVGIGCRAPGGGDNPEALWRVFRDGVDGIVKVPGERWNADALYDSNPEAPGKCITRSGGFIRDIDRFDASLFGISPREAQQMDPQQRLFLEVAWEALELAGIAPDRLQTTKAGVYLGICTNDFCQLQLQSHDLTSIGPHFVSGIAHSTASGRLSYLLGLQGPSISIDTACSSGLVAVHLACQSLRAGESRMAIAAGVNVMASPDMTVALSQGRMLSADGRCKAFDASADGYGRSEGCGVVVLKRLSDATADGDRVLAVIRATAVNQDGPSSGLTAPNGPAQEAVIREALALAGLKPHDVGYIDAHGTGTELGDPLEMRALGNVFGQGRPAETPLYVGSAKSNLGHLEAAAGIMGLLKVVLSLQHQEIAPHLHFNNPSPHIAWDDLPVVVPTERVVWPEINGTRIGGVSSFGVSGTNAHAIIEQAPGSEKPNTQADRSHHIVTVSARSEAALAATAERLAASLDRYEDADHADIAYTLNTGRALLPVRAAFTAATLGETREKLLSIAQHQPTADVLTGTVPVGARPRVAFLFTGQGSQYVGMARTLYDTSPVFRGVLDECAAELDPLLPAPLLKTIFGSDGVGSQLDQTGFAQPALFAVEYALARLWQHWGVEPSVVAGHSVGEVVAACVAGILSLSDALKLIAARGRLMQSLPGGGGMRAVFASLDQIESRLGSEKNEVSVAAINGPEHIVLSGPLASLDRIGKALDADGIKSRPLQVSHAFHSALMGPILEAFENELRSVTFKSPQVRLISNLTGRLADSATIGNARYWRDHIRNPVRFFEGMSALKELKCDAIIEIGPNPTLTALGQQCIGSESATWCASLRRGRDDWQQLLESLKALHMLGVRIDWSNFHADFPRRKLDLPTYPFQRERYWFQAPADAYRVRGRPTGDPLLGSRLHSAVEGAIYETRLTAQAPAFIAHHRVLGRVVLPATAYLDMLLAAGRDVLRSDVVCAENVSIAEAMLFDDDDADTAARMVQTVCAPAADGFVAVSISSIAEREVEADNWVRHITGKLRVAHSPSLDGMTLEQARDRCGEVIGADEFYRGLNRRGGDFGDGFRVIRELWRGKGQAVGRVVLTREFSAEAAAYRIHPALLDGCLQVMIAALETGPDEAEPYLPVEIGRFALYARPSESCWSYAVLEPGSGGMLKANLRVFDNDGMLIAELADVQLKRVGRDILNRLGERWLDECLYETQWKAAPSAASAVAAANWAPAMLTKTAGAAIERLHKSAGIEAYDPFLFRLESLCVDYTLQAMHRLGWQPVEGEKTTEGELAERLGIAARHRRLFGRLLAILEEAQWLRRDQQHWHVVRSLINAQPEQELARLASECPAGARPEIELVGRVAGELAEALRGDRDPMQLLFPGGSIETAEQIYRDSPPAKFFNGLMSEVIAAAQAEVGSRTLRILEVGAGTGGTTAHVAPRLNGHDVEYTFTDVGPLFVNAAAARFGANKFMRFQTLDLERDPALQGLAERKFDIIVAANVIHATADLRQTLNYMRRLLAPGGLLAMLEITAPQRWFDLTVGLTPGWWAFTDSDLRSDYAAMPRDHWLRVLSECGFEAVSALPEGANHRGSVSLQSLLLARATEPAATIPRDWLIFEDRSGFAAPIAERLGARGDRCTLVRLGPYEFGTATASIDMTSPADYRRLIADLVASGRNVHGAIHTWSLDAAPWLGLSAAELDKSQAHCAMSGMLLAQALVNANPTPRLWFVTRGGQKVDGRDDPLSPAQATMWGLGKALMLEHPELRCVCVDLPPRASEAELDALVGELGESGSEPQVGIRDGERRVARLVHARRSGALPERRTEDAWRLVPESPGSLDQFKREPFKRRSPGAGEVEIAVEATGLNFKDVLSVLGMYPGDPGPLGAECAGRVTAVGPGVTHVRPGDSVLALAKGSFASHVITPGVLAQPLPAGMSFEEGASFPVAFLTARYCLTHLAGMQAGNRVLIHAASGGVGMAAVKLAMKAGAEVFATAGSEWKRELLREMGVSHVFDSRSTGFADEILERTGGRGVDLILNSLSDDLIDASFRALARGGTFVEIGKRNIKDPAWVAGLDRDLRYFIVDGSQFNEKGVALFGDMLARLVNELREGTLTSLPRHVFDGEDAARAFRYMAQARHTGKIAVRHMPQRSVTIRRDGTYLVTGGLSGLGLVVARWLAEHGAGRLVLVGRRGVSAEASAILDELRTSGTIVLAQSVDVSDETAVRALLRSVRKDGPPIRGIVHSAGALDDAGLIQQDLNRFKRVFDPKVRGGWLLDRLTRCDPLDWFVMFSSIAGVLGSAGQTNHSAANAFLDLLVHERRVRGLPGTSIDWGAWTQTGAAVDRGVTDRLAARGIGAVTPDQGLVALERLLEADRIQTAVAPIDWTRYIENTANARSSAFLADVAAADTETKARKPGATRAIDLREQLIATPAARRRPLVATFVRERALRALGVDPSKSIDPRTPLGEMGLDSLLSVELRNTLSSAIGQPLPATLLFDYPTIDALTDFLFKEKLNLADDAEEAETVPSEVAPASTIESIENLSDDEVDRLLMARAPQSSMTQE